MNPLVAHIACGHAFFTGSGLMGAALLCRMWTTNQRIHRLRWVLAGIGVLLIAVSSTPIPPWLAIPIVFVSVIALRCQSGEQGRFKLTTLLATSLWIVAITHELLWQQQPALAETVTKNQPPIVILADSITAGLGEGEAITWPALLAKTYPGTIQDLSHVGETVSSATGRVEKTGLPADAIVIVELGGNDLLGSTTHEQFRRDLQRLLERVSGANRTLIMFELPLPPFHHSWGATQREAASKHGVLLIPKRKLMSVLAADNATLDSIHLTQEGHNQMAATITALLNL